MSHVRDLVQLGAGGVVPAPAGGVGGAGTSEVLSRVREEVGARIQFLHARTERCRWVGTGGGWLVNRKTSGGHERARCLTQ